MSRRLAISRLSFAVDWIVDIRLVQLDLPTVYGFTLPYVVPVAYRKGDFSSLSLLKALEYLRDPPIAVRLFPTPLRFGAPTLLTRSLHGEEPPYS